jgi:hypothetical protein
MRGQDVTTIAMRVGRIQDKSRWTKALGEAATVGYGDWKHGREANPHRRAGDRMMNGAHSS